MTNQVLFSRLNPIKISPANEIFSIAENIFPTWQNQTTNKEYLLTSSDSVKFQFAISKSETQNINFRLFADCKQIDVLISNNINVITGLTSDNDTFEVKKVYDDTINNLLVFSIELIHEELIPLVHLNESIIYFELDFSNKLVAYNYRSEKYLYVDDNNLLELYPDLCKIQFRDSQGRFEKGYKFDDKYITVLIRRIIKGQYGYDNEDETSTNLEGEEMMLRDTSLELNLYHFNNMPYFLFDLITLASGFDDFKFNGNRATRVNIPSVKRQTDDLISFEFEVKEAEFSGYLDLEVKQPAQPVPDLVINNTDPSKLSATGTDFMWVHNPDVSYLYALQGKDKINSVTACNAGVSGTVDFTSSEWSNLSYICFKNANNLVLKLGTWVNKQGVSIDVENVYYNVDDFKIMLTELERVNNPNTAYQNRLFNVGTVLVDLSTDPTLKARIDTLISLGWTINIVNYKLLSLNTNDTLDVNLKDRVISNSGSELWLLNSKKVEGNIQIKQGDLLEIYHSDYTTISTISLDNTKASFVSFEDITIQSAITVFMEDCNIDIDDLQDELILKNISGNLGLWLLESKYYDENLLDHRKVINESLRNNLGLDVAIPTYYRKVTATYNNQSSMNYSVMYINNGVNYTQLIRNEKQNFHARRKQTSYEFNNSYNFDSFPITSYLELESYSWFNVDCDNITRIAINSGYYLYRGITLDITPIHVLFTNLRRLDVDSLAESTTSYGKTQVPYSVYKKIILDAKNNNTLEVLKVNGFFNTNNGEYLNTGNMPLVELNVGGVDSKLNFNNFIHNNHRNTLKEFRIGTTNNNNINGEWANIDVNFDGFLKLEKFVGSGTYSKNVTFSNCPLLDDILSSYGYYVMEKLTISNCTLLKHVRKSSIGTWAYYDTKYNDSTTYPTLEIELGSESLEDVYIPPSYGDITRNTVVLNSNSYNTLTSYNFGCVNGIDFSQFKVIKDITIPFKKDLTIQKRVLGELLLSTTSALNKSISINTSTTYVNGYADDDLVNNYVNPLTAKGWSVTYINSSGQKVTT